MEAFDMARKLEFAGQYSPIPYSASPIYITSQIGASLLGSCRVFVPLQYWTRDGVMTVAREISETLGPGEQFDIGIMATSGGREKPGTVTSGEPARLTKFNPESPVVYLMIEGESWKAKYPRLDFQPIRPDEWMRSVGREQ